MLGLLRQVKVMAGRALWGMNQNASTLGTQVIFPPWRVGPANAPTNTVIGPTQGWQFAIGNLVYTEVPIIHGADRTKDITVGVAWAPIGNEAAKVVTWQLDVGFEKAGKSLTTIDATYQAVDQAVPATAGIYVHTAIVIPAADWGADPATDELHIRLSRLVSSADPVTDPGIHHNANIQTLTTGHT